MRSAPSRGFKPASFVEPYREPRTTKVRPRRKPQRANAKEPVTAQEIARSKAQDATDRQVNYLKHLLGEFGDTKTAMAYCAWANGLYWGTPVSLNRWDILKGMKWLSRIYWVRAIEMSLHGRNDLYTAEELVERAGE